MYTRDRLKQHVERIFGESFGIPSSQLRPESTFKELGLDSIDLFDLLVSVEKESGRMLSATDFRDVRTIDDLLGSLERVLNN